ncbi:MAG TPA: glycosyltransferase family A protein, partial [Bacteroidia bacterium]|nr:glycosyltransferase family A protein [Bacteroidia bacterium]
MPAFFSIIIPTYNRRELLKQTVDSVLAQTFRDFEIIVVDDGSTDNTVQYFNENYKGNPLLAIESRENKERGAARNYGLGMAKGTYVLFLDSDDILFNDHLETLHAKILELNNPDFIATKYQFIRNQKINLPGICKFPEGYYDYHFFLNGNPLGCNICVRRANRDLYLFEEDRKYAIKE